MRIDFVLVRILVVMAMVVGTIALSSCGRTPEEPLPATETVAVEEEPLAGLELPLSNTDIGVTLTGIPNGLVATYNDELSIELTDNARRALRYTIFVDRPDLPTRSPATDADFEAFIGKHNEGRVTGRGTLETTFGPAQWAMGAYHEEDQSFEDLRVFVPHPSGTGTMIIASVGPADSLNQDDRLAVVRKLLAFVG